MSQAIRFAVYDGFVSQAGGADGGRDAHLLDEDQYAEGENIICRGGSFRTRPPIIDVDLTFDNPNLTYDSNGDFLTEDGDVTQSENTFFDGLFQEAGYYTLGVGKEYIMASINGRLYQITPAEAPGSASVREIILQRKNRAAIPLSYHLQADIYYIVQDGENAPIIFDGLNARRAASDEIFTGTIMGTGMGRIVLVSGGFIYFGDIFNGTGQGGADMLKFTETLFLNGGFPTKIPAFMGAPTAVKFIPQQDTATGVGECLVFGPNGCESFFLSIPRTEWQNNVFQRTALINSGNVGHRNPCAINQDIWFKDPSIGWRSYRQARAEQNVWGQVPLSTNVRKWTESETPSLQEYGSAVSFNNRLIATTTPYFNQGRRYHNGALSLDFDVISSFGQTSKPSWDGHWSERTANPYTGLKCSQFVEGIFRGRRRAFMFSLGEGEHNVLKELLPDPVGRDTAGPITSRWISRSMDSKVPVNEKSLYQGALWIEEVLEPTTFTPSFRADQVPDFTPWGDPFTVDIVPGQEGEALVDRPGYSPRRDLPKLSDAADTNGTNRLLRRGYEFQTQLEFKGRAKVRKFRTTAIDELEKATASV